MPATSIFKDTFLCEHYKLSGKLMGFQSKQIQRGQLRLSSPDLTQTLFKILSSSNASHQFEMTLKGEASAVTGSSAIFVGDRALGFVSDGKSHLRMDRPLHKTVMTTSQFFRCTTCHSFRL